MNIARRARRGLKLRRLRDRTVLATTRWRSKGTISAADVPSIELPFHIEMGSGAHLVLGRNVRFGRGFSAAIGPGATLEIGDNTAFNINCWIGVTSRITIEGDCLVGPFVSFTDGNHAFREGDIPFWQQGYDLREINIGRNVWIGAKATVIHDIGPGSVIGANAVVSRPVPGGVVAVGIPARVSRRVGDAGGHAEVSPGV